VIFTLKQLIRDARKPEKRRMNRDPLSDRFQEVLDNLGYSDQKQAAILRSYDGLVRGRITLKRVIKHNEEHNRTWKRLQTIWKDTKPQYIETTTDSQVILNQIVEKTTGFSEYTEKAVFERVRLILNEMLLDPSYLVLSYGSVLSRLRSLGFSLDPIGGISRILPDKDSRPSDFDLMIIIAENNKPIYTELEASIIAEEMKGAHEIFCSGRRLLILESETESVPFFKNLASIEPILFGNRFAENQDFEEKIDATTRKNLEKAGQPASITDFVSDLLFAYHEALYLKWRNSTSIDTQSSKILLKMLSNAISFILYKRYGLPTTKLGFPIKRKIRMAQENDLLVELSNAISCILRNYIQDHEISKLSNRVIESVSKIDLLFHPRSLKAIA
jgi:hypothetical protein